MSWISKASAAQRAGRAGRTGPGHCYRLYSSALFENYFDAFSQPEILRMPIEGVVLQMKSMHIDAVVNFPFPTPPDRASLQKAEKVLTYLGALSPSVSTGTAKAKNGSTLGAAITNIGRTMALFPLSPRFSRMLVSGRQHGCLPYVITIVSALSVGDPFLREEALEQEQDDSDAEDEDDISHLTSEAVRAKEARRIRRKAFFQSQQLHASLGNSSSDVLRVLSVVGAYEYAGGGHKFCQEHFVRPKVSCDTHHPRQYDRWLTTYEQPGYGGNPQASRADQQHRADELPRGSDRVRSESPTAKCPPGTSCECAFEALHSLLP